MALACLGDTCSRKLESSFTRLVFTSSVDSEASPERVYLDTTSANWYHATYAAALEAKEAFVELRPNLHHSEFTLIAIALESGE